MINDLHAFCLPRLQEIQRPANVHFTEAGSKALAQQVADTVWRQLQPAQPATETARGVVYHDQNANRVFDSGDTALSGIKVSNGQQIVATDARGQYELPVSHDSILFVIKPQGYRTPVDEKQLP